MERVPRQIDIDKLEQGMLAVRQPTTCTLHETQQEKGMFWAAAGGEGGGEIGSCRDRR